MVTTLSARTRKARAPLLVVLALVSPVSLACQCTGSLEQAFAAAERVVVARVIAARAFPVHFEVELGERDMLKGEPPTGPISVTGIPGLMCGRGHIAVGREYVFFLHEVAARQRGRILSASCQSFEVAGPGARTDLAALRERAGAAGTAPQPAACARLAALTLALEQLSAHYTDEHPEVIALRGLLGEHESALAAANPGRRADDICATDD